MVLLLPATKKILVVYMKDPFNLSMFIAQLINSRKYNPYFRLNFFK